jgi:hypothetical protein
LRAPLAGAPLGWDEVMRQPTALKVLLLLLAISVPTLCSAKARHYYIAAEDVS